MAVNIELTLPRTTTQGTTQTEHVYGDKNDVTSSINLVNKYLWFGLWVVAMVVLVIAWIKLITARGDEKEMKTVNQLMIGLVTGIIIAIFSYILVRVISNVF